MLGRRGAGAEPDLLGRPEPQPRAAHACGHRSDLPNPCTNRPCRAWAWPGPHDLVGNDLRDGPPGAGRWPPAPVQFEIPSLPGRIASRETTGAAHLGGQPGNVRCGDSVRMWPYACCTCGAWVRFWADSISPRVIADKLLSCVPPPPGAATLAAMPVAHHCCARPGWPAAKPITLVVGYPAGGSVDLVARTIAGPCPSAWALRWWWKNVGGAGGTIGAQKVVNAAPDGYTLLLGSGSGVDRAAVQHRRQNKQRDRPHAPRSDRRHALIVCGWPQGRGEDHRRSAGQGQTRPTVWSFASSGVGTPLHVSNDSSTCWRAPPSAMCLVGAAQMVTRTCWAAMWSSACSCCRRPCRTSERQDDPAGRDHAAALACRATDPPLADHPKLKGYDMNVWFGLFGPAKMHLRPWPRLNKGAQ